MVRQRRAPGPDDAPYAVVTADRDIPNRRVLAAGQNITLTDAGPGSTLTIAGSTSPTLTDFSKAAHDHEDAAGGGTLDGAAIAAGTIAAARGGLGADISGVAKGGLLSGTGAGTWGITAVGADGLALVASAAAAGGVAWATAGGYLTPVATYTVAGAAVTTVTFAGLDLATAKHYRFVVRFKHAINATKTVYLFWNNDTDINNYYFQRFTSIGAAHEDYGAKSAMILRPTALACVNAIIDVYADVDGYVRSRVISGGVALTTGLHMQDYVHYWVTVANATRADFTHETASGIAIGTQIDLWQETYP